VGRRPQQQPIDDAEHRRIGTDAKCQRDDCRESEAGRAPELAQRVRKILSDRVEQLCALHVRLPVLRCLHQSWAGFVQAPEPLECLGPCFVLRQLPLADELGDSLLEMEMDLVVDVARDEPTAPDR
jgi:hypothetical protein